MAEVFQQLPPDVLARYSDPASVEQQMVREARTQGAEFLNQQLAALNALTND